MDTRIALPKGTLLRFKNFYEGTVTFMIDREIGRGGSCIVYDAMYSNNTGHMKKVRIKECYPFNVDLIRDNTGALIPENTQIGLFEYYKGQMYRSFDMNNDLFDTVGLTNFISNTIDIFDNVNNTVYIVSTYLEGVPLSVYTPETLVESISIIKSTASTVQKIHNEGFLYLDIKPENIYILNGTTDIIQLFDFDSMISIAEKNELKNDYRIAYSNGYAPLEQKMGKINKIDRCSDIYSIGAVLYYLIFNETPEAPKCSPDARYDYYSSKLFIENNKTIVMKELTDFFHHTLANFCNDRYQNMEKVVTKLRKIEYLCRA